MADREGGSAPQPSGAARTGDRRERDLALLETRPGRRINKEMRALGWRRDGRLQWATAARASSSAGGGWRAIAATGPPRVYPQYGAIRGAWAPRMTSKREEWLEVSFPAGTRARAVWIFETNTAGAVIRVVDETNGSATLYEKARVRDPFEARVLVAPVSPPREIRKVRIHVDMVGHPGWPQIDAVALLEDVPKGKMSKVDWKKAAKPLRTRGATIRLALAFAAGALTTWSCVAPEGLVVGQVAPLRVVSGSSADEIAPGATWATEGQYEGFDAEHIVGPPDQRSLPLSFSSNPRSNAKRLLHAEVAFADEVDARSIVLVETRPFAVVRVDDVSSRLRPVTVWRGATSEPRRGDHGVVRIDLPEPRPISQLRLVFDRDIARGQLDAVGLVPR